MTQQGKSPVVDAPTSGPILGLETDSQDLDFFNLLLVAGSEMTIRKQRKNENQTRLFLIAAALALLRQGLLNPAVAEESDRSNDFSARGWPYFYQYEVVGNFRARIQTEPAPEGFDFSAGGTPPRVGTYFPLPNRVVKPNHRANGARSFEGAAFSKRSRPDPLGSLHQPDRTLRDYVTMPLKEAVDNLDEGHYLEALRIVGRADLDDRINPVYQPIYIRGVCFQRLSNFEQAQIEYAAILKSSNDSCLKERAQMGLDCCSRHDSSVPSFMLSFPARQEKTWINDLPF